MIPDIASLGGTPPTGKTPGALVQVDAQRPWADTLSIGQIIKGRVLRHYGDGKYEVSFSGERRIVDSSIPMTVSTSFKGRVVGLGEKVSIERLPDSGGGAAGKMPIAAQNANRSGLDPALALAMAMRVEIPQADAKVISAASARSLDVDLALRMGVLLAKLGVPVNSLSMQAVREFSDVGVPLARPTAARALWLGAEAVPANGDLPNVAVLNGAVLQRVAEWMAARSEASSEESVPPELERAATPAEDRSTTALGVLAVGHDEGEAGEEPDEEAFRRLMWMLLNTQEGAAISHRYQVLPIMIDGRLVEFDLAMFDHAPRDASGISTRRICFSLDTSFGKVSMDARIVNDSVALSVGSDNARMADQLASSVASLSARLGALGWRLNDADVTAGQHARPARVVVDHLLAYDSLRKVM